MSSTAFPIAERGRRGYDVDEVDAFLEEARLAYEGSADSPITIEVLRHQAFSLKRGGYSTPHVDAALERLEEVFAARARQQAVAAGTESVLLMDVRDTAQAIVNRLARPAGKRFRHAGPVTLGYRRSDVDQFADKLLRYFSEGWPMTIADVRTVVFREQRGGYREDQVDALLDAVIDVMLAAG